MTRWIIRFAVVLGAFAAATGAATAETKIRLGEAPAGLAQLMNAHKTGDDACELFTRAKPETIVATVHPLDATRRLVIMACSSSQRFDFERIFVATGDDFANAKPARLPVPKTKGRPHDSGFVSDVMQADFNESKKQLWTSTYVGGDCWRQHSWAWRSGGFVRLTNRKNCAG